jgi:hypothetical protein
MNFDVFNSATGATETLADFVARLLGDGSEQPDPATLDQMDKIKAQRKARAALDNICESVARRQPLNASDVQNLTLHHLQEINANGDAYLRGILTRMLSETGDSFDDAWDEICCFHGRTTRTIPCNGLARDCPFRRDRTHGRDRDGGREYGM